VFKRDTGLKPQEKVIDVEAGMEGSLKFSSPVNLRINSTFKGELEMMGVLVIGEKADVKAKIIKGEEIIVAGKIKGNIECAKSLKLLASANVIGDIKTPTLIINEGAMLTGKCQVPFEQGKAEPKTTKGKSDRQKKRAKKEK
jgi:cytoskeletal protein CcmA (bactofilin family)